MKGLLLIPLLFSSLLLVVSEDRTCCFPVECPICPGTQIQACVGSSHGCNHEILQESNLYLRGKCKCLAKGCCDVKDCDPKKCIAGYFPKCIIDFDLPDCTGTCKCSNECTAMGYTSDCGSRFNVKCTDKAKPIPSCVNGKCVCKNELKCGSKGECNGRGDVGNEKDRLDYNKLVCAPKKLSSGICASGLCKCIFKMDCNVDHCREALSNFQSSCCVYRASGHLSDSERQKCLDLGNKRFDDCKKNLNCITQNGASGIEWHFKSSTCSGV